MVDPAIFLMMLLLQRGLVPMIHVKNLSHFCSVLKHRLQGITKSMSRFPTFKRRFDDLVKSLCDDQKLGGPIMTRSKSAFARLVSFKSFKGTRNGSSHGLNVVRDIENS